MTDFTDKAAMDAFNSSTVEEFRSNAGKVSGQFEGATLLLLTSTGAKSGEPRLNPLVYFAIGDRIVIVGAKAGSDTNPHWVHNLRANPRAHVEVGTEAYDVTARELPTEDRDAVFEKIVAAAPGFGEYQSQTNRVIPLFELERA
jgi:deazaflavin-dependent oxidoreductase (nitroreductase family)